MTSMPAKGKREVVLVNDSSLQRIDDSSHLLRYLRQVYIHRHFMLADAKARSFSSGRNTFLGRSWLLLDPFFQIAIYAVVFGLIMRSDKGVDNFIGFLAVGVTVFQTITRTYNAGNGVIQSSRALITSFHFPRIIVVFSRCLEAWMNCMIPVIVGIGFAVVLQRGNQLAWEFLLLIPFYFLILVFSFGLACIIARLTAFVPDFKSLITLATRGLFFLSGIFYSIDRFADDNLILQLVNLNPVYQFLDAFRTVILDGRAPESEALVYLNIWSFALLLVGFVFFWKAEERYAYVK